MENYQVSKIEQVPMTPRFINPNDSLEKQVEVLMSLIKRPPETSRVITFTPKLAQYVLENLNRSNRPKRPTKIMQYATDMEKEEWVLSGDTIKFSVSGKLADGQHRLRGCLLSGAAFRTHVVFGISDEAFAVIDAGAGRTKPDTAFTDGLPHHLVSAAALRWLMIYRVKRLANNNPDRGLEITNKDLLSFYQNEVNKERFRIAVERAVAGWDGRLRGAIAAHLYLFDEQNPRAAKEFADDLAAGVRVGKKLPDRIESLRKQAGGRLHENVINALIIVAWNAFRAGKTITASTLSWSDNREFPEISK
jgi:hypothetical protein